ncbi:unnamed protein product [Effrenium voratum]|nr:unnamed protein product [Effrenium voratum]
MLTCRKNAMADDALGLCLPGLADEFHIVADSTHAAFGARLNTVVGYAEAQLLATELAQDRLFGNHGSSHSMLEKIPFWLLQQGLGHIEDDSEWLACAQASIQRAQAQQSYGVMIAVKKSCCKAAPSWSEHDYKGFVIFGGAEFQHHSGARVRVANGHMRGFNQEQLREFGAFGTSGTWDLQILTAWRRVRGEKIGGKKSGSA